MLIPRLHIEDTNSVERIKSELYAVPDHTIACVNWPDLYPSQPEASFKIAHNGTHLFLQYFVCEDEIVAQTVQDNGSVWKDSCVEFFIAFGDSPYYYNAEFSCIGKALLGYRKERKDAQYGDSHTMSMIKRYPSLGTDLIDKTQGDYSWDLLLVIPVQAFWMSGLSSFNGVKARANFYKCGDGLTLPHYLSWAGIESERPNFHTIDFFSDLSFE